MNWIKLKKENLPEREVLVTNSRLDYLVGYVSYDEEQDSILTEGEGISMYECTHYCILEKPIC